jgi:ketosteroid isomerase-like protein
VQIGTNSAVPISREETMNFKRFAFIAAAVIFMLPCSSQNLFAADKDDIVATIHQFADNLDPKTIDKGLAACDSSTSIIDEFPPHVWNSCADWAKAFGEYNDKNAVTDADAKILAPWSVDVDGDRAYAVAPATYTYKQKGKLMKEPHAVFTAAFRKTDAGWRITAWTWSKH